MPSFVEVEIQQAESVVLFAMCSIKNDRSQGSCRAASLEHIAAADSLKRQMLAGAAECNPSHRGCAMLTGSKPGFRVVIAHRDELIASPRDICEVPRVGRENHRTQNLVKTGSRFTPHKYCHVTLVAARCIDNLSLRTELRGGNAVEIRGQVPHAASHVLRASRECRPSPA